MLVEVAVFTVNAVKGVFQLLKYVWTLIGDREIIIRGAKLIERNRLFRIPIAVDGDISIELPLLSISKDSFSVIVSSISCASTSFFSAHSR